MPSTPEKQWRNYSPASKPCSNLGSGLTRYEQDFEETKVIAKGRSDCFLCVRALRKTFYLKLLSTPSFGVVTKCKKRVDGCFYAVKRTLKRFKGGTSKNQALKEVFALAALPAIPNIVRYFSAWVEVGVRVG